MQITILYAIFRRDYPARLQPQAALLEGGAGLPVECCIGAITARIEAIPHGHRRARWRLPRCERI